MNIKHASAAVEMAVQATERLKDGLDDCEQRLELSEWIEMNLDNPESLQNARRLALTTDLSAYSYLVRSLRMAGSAEEVKTNATREVLCLIGIPMFMRGTPEKKIPGLMEWEPRQRIERHLEETLKMRLLSFRLNRFPVEAVPLAALTPAQQRRLILELNEYGDSRLIQPPRMEVDAEGYGLVWPGIVRLRADDYEAEHMHFRAMITAPEINEWRKYAAQELTESFKQFVPDVTVAVYPPAPYPDTFSTYRLMKLMRTMEVLASKGCESIIYRIRSGMLTIWLCGTDDKFISAYEMDFSEDSPEFPFLAVNRLQKKLRIPAISVEELPPLPGEASINTLL